MKIAFFLFLPFFLTAQQVTLSGVVTVFNSKFETGKTEYVANAQIKEVFDRATPAITNSDGTFNLVLVGVKERTSFDFQVQKTRYEVVNTDQLRAVAGQLDAVRIFMAPVGKISENKRKYYQIGKTGSEKALEQKIANKQREVRALRADQASNRQKINQIEKEIADLYQRYQTIDQNARELAERFSRVNLDDASELYQRAFRHFQNGSIDSALIVLDEVNWVARVDSILTEEARLFALKNIIDFNDSVLTRQRDSSAGAIRVKIQSHLGLRHYREALRTSEWLLKLHTQDTANLLASYRQATWLALLAQEFPLAKLYAQTGLDMAKGRDPLLQRYRAYALCLTGAGTQSRQLIQALRDHADANLRETTLRDLQELEIAYLPAASLVLLRQCLD